jgi:gluconate 2-dehydrogenase subunit 3-like protein
MSKHDEGRRAFLVGTAIGAGAAAGAALIPEALAQSSEQHGATNAPAPVTHMMSGGHGAFLNDDDTRTIAAFAERLMPGAPGKPGAADANVVNYIDLALSGAYADRQEFYRRGIAQLDAYCAKTFGKAFRFLPAAQQDETIAALEQGKVPGFDWPKPHEFFEVIRTHTMEGMFADPIYGGNRDFAGWRLVQFPGAQPIFTESDMHSTKPFTREPIVGLQTRAKG